MESKLQHSSPFCMHTVWLDHPPTLQRVPAFLLFAHYSNTFLFIIWCEQLKSSHTKHPAEAIAVNTTFETSHM